MYHHTQDGRPPVCPIDGTPLEELWQVMDHHRRCIMDLIAQARGIKYGLGFGRGMAPAQRRQLEGFLAEAKRRRWY